MSPTDITIHSASLYLLPVETRVPLKFGTETLTAVHCARVCVEVSKADGSKFNGWGETPLNVQWAWPSNLPYSIRNERMIEFCRRLTKAWAEVDATGHALEIGHYFIENVLPGLLNDFNRESFPDNNHEMPWLAALVCASAFDIAVHDAYGYANDLPVYKTYQAPYLNYDLSHYLEPESRSGVSFEGLYPKDFLAGNTPKSIPVCHLVGGMDKLYAEEITAEDPRDGYPVDLLHWIREDGLNFLKIKLRGNDREWDMQRLVEVGKITQAYAVDWLTADFNCTVQDPQYVNSILDELMREHPVIFQKILYVEQPFPYELETHQIDVHSVSARKPLFMDESAHDWKLVRLGRQLGWTGVALKTCKTQTGALLSLCWAKAHGMTLMVQDLTNPMLAQIPHCLLAAHAETIMGVESNGMQFYPAASSIEAVIHPGLYKRNEGKLNLETIHGSGFGYRISEINRPLPEPEIIHQSCPI